MVVMEEVGLGMEEVVKEAEEEQREEERAGLVDQAVQAPTE